ncbi:MAG: Crp/Fnr family transcriptional regulator, partial [Candidatus Omnitrophica bacterium]|nr:Crp/Fnr family transcriptional regulator [Candidatus Omnitrophota bacterium]
LGDRSEWRRFRKGERLFEEGQPAASVWVIQRGWVYLVKRAPQGIPVTIFTITPEEVLCGFSAVVGQSAYYASAVSATDTTAIRVPQAGFARLLSEQPGFAEKVLAIYHTRMRHMAEAISLAQAPVEQRLAYVLLRLRATFGKTIPITHHELSHMAGTRWETSIRTLSVMKRKGWIASSRAKITVLASAKLQGLLNHQAPT